MNKSALLHMVRNVSTLSDQDVEELEKLVKNFPYCQTAHLLIAKASYDKGNMLSNQKLRKAAAYATNRQLLKKLIYTTDATVPVTVIENQNIATNHHEVVASVQTDAGEADKVTTVDQEKETLKSFSFQENLILEPASPLQDQTQELSENEESLTQASDVILPVPELYSESTVDEEPGIFVEETSDQPESANNDLIDVSRSDEPVTETIEILSNPGEEELILLPSFEPANSLTLSELEEMLQVEKWTSSVNPSVAAISSESASAIQDLPIETETNETNTAAEIIRYELEVPDDLEESTLDQTLAQFDSYLFKPEQDEFFNSELKPATTEEFIREVYTSNQLGYWMGSSRLGELLQVKDELTHHTPLQFYPDLILEYSKQNYLTPTDPPKMSPANRQFEIIDQFLKSNPKLKTFSNEKVRTEPQDDLAFKSTKNTKNLASENLANIMVQQGKIKKAIKIYEHLIVKIPEKRAYFAAQIEKLRNQI